MKKSKNCISKPLKKIDDEDFPSVLTSNKIIQYYLKYLGFSNCKKYIGIILLIITVISIGDKVICKNKYELYINIGLLIIFFVLFVVSICTNKKTEIDNLYNKLNTEHLDFLGNEELNSYLRDSISNIDKRLLDLLFTIIGSVISLISIFSIKNIDLIDIVLYAMLIILSFSLINDSSNKLIFKDLLEHIRFTDIKNCKDD